MNGRGARRLAFDLHPLLLGMGPWNDLRNGATYQSSRVARGTPFQNHYQPHNNTNMHFLSSLLTRFTPEPHITPLANAESMQPGDWKDKLAAELPPPHDQSPFDRLISDYVTGPKPDLSLMVCECMKNGKVDVLRGLLAYEDMTKLSIQGPVDEKGWETLAKAMPNSLLVAELKLSKVTLDASKCELLFNKVLSHMPALEDLSLTNVKVEDGFFFDRLVCPDLPRLKTLSVFGKSDPGSGAALLLERIFPACQVQRLSIEESGEITSPQHRKLAKALGQQTRLDSLRLKIMNRNTPEEFECYMPFLCGKTLTPLVELDLRGCRILGSNFNPLIKALSQNQPMLKSLLVGECCVARNEKSKVPVSIDIVSLAEMKSLQYLDLSSNELPAGMTAALLAGLKKIQLVTLNLNRNAVGKETFSAVAFFLRDNDKLRHLSFIPPAFVKYLGAEGQVLEELTEAMERNLVLQQLDIRLPKDSLERLAKALDRNKQLAIAAAARGGVYAIGSRHHLQVPYDVADLVFQHGLTGLALKDALSASSVNKEAWELRERILREESERILQERL